MDKEPNKINWKQVATISITAIGIIGSVLTVYSVFFQSKKALLEYEITSNTNVLDINANVSKLDILYNSLSLKTNHQNLRIFNVRVKNSGNDNILKDLYDDNDPIGIKIRGGAIIELPEITSASNNYLAKNVKIKVNSSDEISFNNLIIEPNQSYNIKLLVLYDLKSNPIIESKGKIAGQNEIQILHLESSKENRTIWKDITTSDFIIQAIRLLVYGTTMIILLGIVIFVSQRFTEYKDKTNRIRLVNKYKRSANYVFDEWDNIVFDTFINDSSVNFMLPEYLKDPEQLNSDYSAFMKSSKSKTIDHSNVIKKLLTYNLIVQNGEIFEIDNAYKIRFEAFKNYLEDIHASYTSYLYISS